ncbi:amine dehydrogenase large subunit [Mesorhizobium sp. LSJC269B00]|uniref:amine dehydrogenase large subunit n=1 Tax=Mesorhizobium sp. LSJC269B00 TaxID=1287326 RepID=UPI0012EB884A|nr:amine dehydrogenase large subunit [Mesorhizobium sp. LSJC269B00]
MWRTLLWMPIVIEIERGDFGLLRIFRRSVEGFPVIESPAPNFTAAAVGLFTVVAAIVTATLAAHAQQLEQEEVTVETIPAGAKKVYLADMAANHNVDGRLYILNADDLKFLGIVGTGFDGMIYLPHRESEIYVATTYYSKLTRGERLDLLEVYDASSLALKEEIEIPKTRAQAASYRPLMQGSADDRFVFIQNATPATSITVVDMDAKAATAEISNDGCYGTYPAAGNPLRFSTICGDGTFGTYTLAQDGKSAERKSSTKLFDADEEALFSHAERDGQSWLFVSYGGTVYRVNFEGETVELLETFPLNEGVEGSWRPGGAQPIAYHSGSGVLFALMHSGGAEGSHKNPAEEIWAFDVRKKALLSRSPTKTATSLTVSTAETPTLFAINPIDATVIRYTADPAARFPLTETHVEKVGETVIQVEAD